MSEVTSICISDRDANQRVDLFLTEKFPEHTRSYFNKLIRNKYVTVNGEAVKSGYVLKNNDQLQIEFFQPTLNLEPAEIALNIVHEDEDILVINKPAGIAVHPGAGTEENTLVHGLLYHTKNLAKTQESERPGIVHRLDKNTSGLLVVAKNEQALVALRRQFDTREIHRIYHALVWGELAESEGTISTFIARSRRDPTKMAVSRTGKKAVTHYRLLQSYRYVSYIELKLDTGRTHQIRVHMNHLHHPVVGDQDYNGRESQLKQLPPQLKKRGNHLIKILTHQALHAKKLSFIHPQNGQELTFESELPDEMKQAIDKLTNLFLLD